MARDYVVVYEEPYTDDPGDDQLVLDVDVHGGSHRRPAGVEADFGAAVTNESGGVAVLGLVMTIFGGLAAIAAAVLFMLWYPDAWWDQPPNTTQARIVVGTGIGAGVLMILGNLFVGFGRNLRARGVLHSLRFSNE